MVICKVYFCTQWISYNTTHKVLTDCYSIAIHITLSTTLNQVLIESLYTYIILQDTVPLILMY